MASFWYLCEISVEADISRQVETSAATEKHEALRNKSSLYILFSTHAGPLSLKFATKSAKTKRCHPIDISHPGIDVLTNAGVTSALTTSNGSTPRHSTPSPLHHHCNSPKSQVGREWTSNCNTYPYHFETNNLNYSTLFSGKSLRSHDQGKSLRNHYHPKDCQRGFYKREISIYILGFQH